MQVLLDAAASDNEMISIVGGEPGAQLPHAAGQPNGASPAASRSCTTAGGDCTPDAVLPAASPGKLVEQVAGKQPGDATARKEAAARKLDGYAVEWDYSQHAYYPVLRLKHAATAIGKRDTTAV